MVLLRRTCLSHLLVLRVLICFVCQCTDRFHSLFFTLLLLKNRVAFLECFPTANLGNKLWCNPYDSMNCVTVCPKLSALLRNFFLFLYLTQHIFVLWKVFFAYYVAYYSSVWWSELMHVDGNWWECNGVVTCSDNSSVGIHFVLIQLDAKNCTNVKQIFRQVVGTFSKNWSMSFPLFFRVVVFTTLEFLWRAAPVVSFGFVFELLIFRGTKVSFSSFRVGLHCAVYPCNSLYNCLICLAHR